MLKIGLTGNIGSGKTVVAQLFFSLGIPVFHADFEARKLFHETDVKEEIKQYFGEEVFDPSGEIFRPALASIVFSNNELLQKLNTIIHPRVRQNFKEWLGQYEDKPYALYEAAILFESGHYKELDKVICVTAPEELRIKRVMERDKVDREDIEKRIANQWREAEKIKLADFVIVNDGIQDLNKQVEEVHLKIVGL